MRRLVVVTLVTGVWALALVPSCLEPTKITLDVRTDVRCAATKQTAVTAGKPGVTERAAPTTVAPRCDEPGVIGTLVVTPESDDAGRISIKVVMGVTADASSCTPDNQYKGCIVARREIAFVEHTPLELPIDMLYGCLDKPCDPSSTCASNGACVPAAIRDAAGCVPPNRCYPEGDPSNDNGGLGGETPPARIDPSDAATDRSSSDGASSDGAASDGAGIIDAGGDGAGIIDAGGDGPLIIDAGGGKDGAVVIDEDGGQAQN